MISYHYKEQKKRKGPISEEVILREAFLRSALELLDGQGFEKWTIEQMRGQIDLLEKFVEVRDE